MTNNELLERAEAQLNNCGPCAHLQHGRCLNDDLASVKDPENGQDYTWSCSYFFSDCLSVANQGWVPHNCAAATLASLPCPGFLRRNDL